MNTSMDRRTLLRFLLATPAAAMMDYEKLLWVPKPQIVVPPPPVVWKSRLWHDEMNQALKHIYFGAVLIASREQNSLYADLLINRH